MKRKFKVLLPSIMMLVFFFLTACSSGSSSTSSSDTPDSAPKDQTFNFTYTSVFPPAKWDYEGSYYGIEEFVTEVEKRSEGRITFEKSYSNSLVPQNELLDALAAGTVDFGFTSPGFYSDIVPAAAFSTLPFWAHTDEFAFQIFRDTEIGDLLEKNFENYGAKIMMWMPTGEYGFVSNKPIRKFEDFNGLIIRSGGALWNTWYEEMGAAPANVSVVEAYEALQRGTINAQGTPYHNIETFNYHEVAPYMIRPPVYASTFMISLASQQAWNSLPEDLQTMMTEVAREMEDKAIEGAKIFNENNDSMAESFGVEVITLPDEEIKKLEESGKVAWEKFASMSDDNARMVEILEEELTKAGR
ncbi:TRAP transporter substrate-binding protein [Bacillus sp. Marseille-P3661]|uniref:TRAP transporter substrate-binding protein n=1 Tax=Bacillus sp. Marseille-P3661 TaxID=1936234 RepID=UPI000C84DDF0|nr:TRAP transporter substrate-binding protein [Bacillus sp. Marseille-P3661]